MEREKKAKEGIYKVKERWINNEKERKRERGIKKEASVMLEMWTGKKGRKEEKGEITWKGEKLKRRGDKIKGRLGRYE